MVIKRIIAAAFVLGLGPALGACASTSGGAPAGVGSPASGTYSESSFSAYVADHWPHWAGGMPSDVPPRPGAPGYDEFVAHGQANADAAKTGTIGNQPAVGDAKGKIQTTPTFQTRSTAQTTSAVRAAPAEEMPATDTEPADDPSTVRGGLY